MTKRRDDPIVSVVIVNLNGKNWLEKCIPSVLSSDYPKDKVEIILVDNGSRDGSVKFIRELAKRKHAKFKIIQNRENRGWSPANNQGAEIAEGDILLFLSNDMEVDKNWIKEITKIFKLDSKTGVVQCNSISMWDRKTLDSSMNYLDRYGFAYSYVPQERPCKVFFAEGMAFAIRKNVFDMIDGFDEYYFMEYDDIDLCWRARLAGYEVYFSPKSIVYHARGGTVGALYFERNTRNITQYARNHIVTIIKNYELKNLFKILPIVVTIQIAKILYFTFIRNFKLIKATFKGLFYVLSDLRYILSQREEVQQKLRKVRDKNIIKCMHPFRPNLLFKYISFQGKGKKFIINAKPPIKM